MQIEPLVILGVGVLVVCLALFYIIRFVTYLRHPEYRSSAKVTPRIMIINLFLVSGILVLFWYAELGNKIAAVVYTAIFVAATIVGRYLLQQSGGSKGKNDS